MPTDITLIPDPVLDNWTEPERIAARIHRSIGGVTSDGAQAVVDYGKLQHGFRVLD